MSNTSTTTNTNNNNKAKGSRRAGVNFLMVVVLFAMGWHLRKHSPVSSSSSSSVKTTTGIPKRGATTAATTTTTTTPKNPQQQILLPMAQASLRFLQSRKQVYTQAGILQNWHLRGIAYLHEHQRVLLVGRHVVVVERSNNNNNKRHYIRVDNVYNLAHNNHDDDHNPPPDCLRLSIWVRVAGPEIFAGKALPVRTDNDDPGNDCYWTFDFEPQQPGSYKIDAKVLMWDSVVRQDFFLTDIRQGDGTKVPDEIQERYSIKAGFKGFKMYHAQRQCSDACTRQVGCRYWASPPANLPDPSYVNNGCDFWFDPHNLTDGKPPFASWLLGDINVTWPRDPPKRPPPPPKKEGRRQRRRRRRLNAVKIIHGYPSTKPIEYYVGCGWNPMFTLDFPCMSGLLDDKVYIHQERIEIHVDAAKTPSPSLPPLCSLPHEALTSFPSPQLNNNTIEPATGRWVREAWPNASMCPQPFGYDDTIKTYFKISRYDDDHPHCWHRDNLHDIGWNCVEMNCRFIRESSIHRDTEFRSTTWSGVWKPYGCDLLEYTTAELQQCVDGLKIKEFKTQGASIAAQYRNYLEPRIKNLKLYQGQGGRTVSLGTNKMLHALSDIQENFLQSVDKMANMTEDGDTISFVAGTYFLSSVRDIADWESMAFTNNILKQHLIPKGYKYINTFDMSAAMTFDTGSQMDGMHLVGPVPKMVLTKFFHYLCKDVVNGGARL
mmetsp:Transcript_8264/g.17640  ORF Transcript_8264/g.17640 Transcript_8264/m.17640 type:complete len:715 (-) Transcript_8264:1376-3520(-)